MSEGGILCEETFVCGIEPVISAIYSLHTVVVCIQAPDSCIVCAFDKPSSGHFDHNLSLLRGRERESQWVPQTVVKPRARAKPTMKIVPEG